MSCIKGSNPFVSAKPNKDAPSGAFFCVFNFEIAMAAHKLALVGFFSASISAMATSGSTANSTRNAV